MAAALSDEELLLQIQCLVSDALRVVSYKWLSRNFSLPSNAAKWLLQKFADKSENSDLEVVYAVSGWAKKEPHSYVIQLVPKSKFEEASTALKEPSIHIYSVQRCLPKDPAQLWSADFIQAEQLFNEPADIDNCLRDNRFSAVTCQLVQRIPKIGRVASPPQSKPSVSNGLAVKSTTSTSRVPPPPVQTPKTPVPSLPPKISEAGPKDPPGGKKSTPPSTSSKQNEPKDPSASSSAGGKRKAPPFSSSGSAGGGSLASMWGKAPAKSKTVRTPTTAAPASTAEHSLRTSAAGGDAEARIQAAEANYGSEDDMANEFANLRRGKVSNSKGRRCRMILDDDDDDDNEDDKEADEAEDDGSETIIRLGSPPESPPKRKPAEGEFPSTNVGTSNADGKFSKVNKEVLKEQEKPSKTEQKLRLNPDSKTNTTRGEEVAEMQGQPVASNRSKGSSKRKKVLKTQIDDRGREVNEVVWETEGEEKENDDKAPVLAVTHSIPSSKYNDDSPPPGKTQTIQKPPTAASKAPTAKSTSKTSAKSANKPGKGQGSIKSFFKKT